MNQESKVEKSIYNQLKKVFDDNGIDIDKYSFDEIESVVYISLIIDIETEFDIIFEEEFLDVNIFKNMNLLIEYIQEEVEKAKESSK